MRALLLAILVLAPGTAVFGQNQSWVGHKVVTKYKTPLKVNDRVVNDDGVRRVYTVKNAEGNWLWLESGSVAGWAPASDVVLYESAIDHYTNELKQNPTNAAAYGMRAVHWRDQGEHDIAIADYNEMIRLEPQNPVAYNNRGNAWVAKRQYDRAIADYSAAIRLDPTYASAYKNRGNAWSSEKQFDKAIADYNQAIRLNPKDAWAYNNRAWVLATCPDATFRDGQKAVELATKACELSGWKEACHLGTLGAAYAETGRFDKACEMQERANSLYAAAADKAQGGERLELYRQAKPFRLASHHQDKPARHEG